jgi:hypothetical protein
MLDEKTHDIGSQMNVIKFIFKNLENKIKHGNVPKHRNPKGCEGEILHLGKATQKSQD